MLKWITAIALIMNGIGHVVFFFAAWTAVPMGFLDNPWILPGAFTVQSAVGKLSALLWLIAMAGFVVAGIGLLARKAWWPSLAVVAAVISLVVIIPWWNTIDSSTRFWAALADIVVIAAFALPWKRQVIASLT